ncbi:phosphate acetyltransferase [Thorsellia kenyensis]|uniref:Phosphate acetyltransferase n=1 Tax=Thorsellia kenyensis TaxID=1549888 RepID=A0ABV6CD07_9GAMM
MLIPTSVGVGLTSVSLGMVHAMEQKGMSVSFFKPIAQTYHDIDAPDHTSEILKANSSISIGESIEMKKAEALLGTDQEDELLEEILNRFHQNNDGNEIALIEGIVPTRRHEFANHLNFQIAKTLDAEIIFVMALGNEGPEQIKKRLEIATASIGGTKNPHIMGVIINKLNAPVDDMGRLRPDLSDIFEDNDKIGAQKVKINPSDLQIHCPLPILATIPWNPELIATRAIDLAKHLNARVINEGDIAKRRIKSVTFCSRSIPTMLSLFRSGSLLVTSADRPEVLVAISLSAMNGVEIGAVLLTGGYELDARITRLCEQAFKTGLPVFLVDTNTWQTSLNLQNINLQVPPSDKERAQKIMHFVAEQMNANWIEKMTANSKRARRLSPAAFRFQLTEYARKANKCIVLPEGNEPRTIKAAVICAERGIARTILLGEADEINHIAESQGLILPSSVQIMSPKSIRGNYVDRLVELRKSKGITEVVAKEQLRDNVMLGTMMLERGEVDGLVSGAVNTTANTIRPPLQIIKTAPGSSIVSSVFFMLLPEQVLVYGDCAINPDPTAEQLAEIAIQSADSATAFGIEPKVAMISYSTGTSGAGSDVDKVREATEIAKAKRPDLIIDGPLQYDAAVMADVARSKAPDSPVAGKATVFIFPDLNTGNTTYKAVQRSANLISIGPMLQGMRKPVNDLSRGALVDDIVYTIALTAIQATQS